MPLAQQSREFVAPLACLVCCSAWLSGFAMGHEKTATRCHITGCGVPPLSICIPSPRCVSHCVSNPMCYIVIAHHLCCARLGHEGSATNPELHLKSTGPLFVACASRLVFRA